MKRPGSWYALPGPGALACASRLLAHFACLPVTRSHAKHLLLYYLRRSLATYSTRKIAGLCIQMRRAAIASARRHTFVRDQPLHSIWPSYGKECVAVCRCGYHEEGVDIT